MKQEAKGDPTPPPSPNPESHDPQGFSFNLPPIGTGWVAHGSSETSRAPAPHQMREDGVRFYFVALISG